MRKTKIIISLAVVAAITVTGVCALANGRVSEKRGNRPSFKMTEHVKKRPELTEAQKAQMEAKKAERLEEAKVKLAEKLSAGEITEEQYNEMLEKLGKGDFGGRGKGSRRGDKAENSKISIKAMGRKINK